MKSHYHFNGEEYCEDCLPVSSDYPDVDIDYGEQDTPANCHICLKPLDYTLTQTGVEHVLEKITNEYLSGDMNTIFPQYKGTFYQESRHGNIVGDWAKNLLGYSLSCQEEALVKMYLELMDYYNKETPSYAETDNFRFCDDGEPANLP